jgi:hypothetical protein
MEGFFPFSVIWRKASRMRLGGGFITGEVSLLRTAFLINI